MSGLDDSMWESLAIASYMNILPHNKIWYRNQQECQWWYFNHKMWPNAKHEDELVSATYANFLFMIYDNTKHDH